MELKSQNRDQDLKVETILLSDYFFDDVRETACLKSCSEMKMTFGFPFVSDSGLATSFVKLYFKSSVYVKKSVYSYRFSLARFGILSSSE